MAIAASGADRPAAGQRRRRTAPPRRWNAPPRPPPRPAAGWAGAAPPPRPARSRRVGEASTGAIVSTIWCSASSISPSPMATRPRSRTCCRLPRRKASTPASTSAGKTAVNIEGQQWDHQRGADIGAQHGRQRRRQPHRPGRGEGADHQCRRRTGLQRRRHPEPGQEGPPAAAQRHPQHLSQPAAEGPLNPALDHVQAPEQQRCLPRQFQQQPRFRHAQHLRRRLSQRPRIAQNVRMSRPPRQPAS